MKKKSVLAVNALLVAALLCACMPQSRQIDTVETTGQTTAETTVETEIIQPTADTVQNDFQWKDTPTHNAFRKTLKTIHDHLYFPNLGNPVQIDLWEPGTIEDEMFAVLDVDGDGEEELLVRISNTYVAASCVVIYGFNSNLDDVQKEVYTGFLAKFYPGMIRVDASHNHGHAGDVLWPYTILTYDEEKDVYQDTFYVDAWSKEIAEYDSYLEMAYPEDIDTDHEGFVYLITENSQQRIINRQAYEAWETEMFDQKEPLTIPWQKMTAENIGLE